MIRATSQSVKRSVECSQSRGRPALVALVLISTSIFALGANASSTTPETWSWSVNGVLGQHAQCSSKATSSAQHACAYSVSRPAKDVTRVKFTFSVSNLATRTVCYGVSLSTSYDAGLQSICVKPKSHGQYSQSGVASHFDQASVSVFVTSGSKNRPIAPEASASSSPFTISFLQVATS